MFAKNAPCRALRYSDELPENVVELFNDRHITFEEARNTPEPVMIGWCNPDDLSDGVVVNYAGALLTTGFVQYKRSVSAKALNFEVKEAMKKELELTGRKFLPRDRKKEIKEATKVRLLSRIPVQPSVTNIIIDQALKLVYVYSSSSAIIDEIRLLLEATCNLSAIYERTVVDFLPEESDMVDPEKFGEDFLTWLWYTNEVNSYATYANPSGDGLYDYSILPDEKIVVGNEFTGICSVNGDIREARNGIFNGKRVSKFSFILYMDSVSNPQGGRRIAACVLNKNLFFDRISFSQDLVQAAEDGNKDEAIVLFVNETTEHVYSFMQSAISEFCKIYFTGTWDKLQEEVWNWSRGDICLKAFADI